uniref:Uncharacterized protein n=1 Tax=Mucochytrium quahogii TaxID=96639 RepID=A0A7S2WKN2_9STRA|mmetsp:Transcript_4831/g.7314  ORF Transcript_4831/g.7314 Transcript_4831/m.7314 type:complete len:202 (-) Transcript_4831:162-767(-)
MASKTSGSLQERTKLFDFVKRNSPEGEWSKLQHALRNKAVVLDNAPKEVGKMQRAALKRERKIKNARTHRLTKKKRKELFDHHLSTIEYKDLSSLHDQWTQQNQSIWEQMAGSYKKESFDEVCLAKSRQRDFISKTDLTGAEIRVVHANGSPSKVRGIILDISANTVLVVTKANMKRRFPRKGTKFHLVSCDIYFWGDSLK